jgi:hypothetical protein
MADSITDGGAIVPAQPYFDAAQFIDDPVGVVGGVGTINACLVGTTVDGVVLAFRGTLPFNPDSEQAIHDWINDLDADLVHGGGLPGLVHAGFCGSVDSVWATLVTEVQNRLSQAGHNHLYVTGHSKGGAMANLAAMRFLIEQRMAPDVYTYAAPHPGNQDFAAAYDKRIQGVRYEFADDIVAHLPPSLAFDRTFAFVSFVQSYSAVGTLRYITKTDGIVSDSPTLPVERDVSLAKLMANGDFREIIEDHSGACGGGYMRAICPQGVCP